MIRSYTRTGAHRHRRILLALPVGAAAAAALVACSSSSSSSSSAPSSAAPSSAAPATSSGTSSSPAAGSPAGTSSVTSATIGGVKVLTNSKGFTLYSFAPDTATKSNCNGACAAAWPPEKGPVTASGFTATFGTITRSDGSTQATFHGHPLYTYIGDTAPGQASGNGVNAFGGLWHEVPASGSAAPAGTTGQGGVGY
jgi:predicted lipoprotein with Yx(FWY)xxD motif